MYGLAHCFLDSETDKSYTRRKLDTLKSKFDTLYLYESLSTQPGNDFIEIKIAHNMALRFKSDKTFCGKIGQDVIEYITKLLKR